MLGIKYIKFDSMTHVIHFKGGRVAKEGRGLAFYYFEPNSSIVAIPIGSNDLPFIFSETTNDYQDISIQGQITYRIDDPNKLSELLDFTVDARAAYKKNDLEKLHQRIINEAQAATSSFVHSLGLKESLRSARLIESEITSGLRSSRAISLLGIEIVSVNVTGVRATPEMARALETETREKLSQDADQAIYERRNFAVEQERKIKESELNTEIAVEIKKREIDEKKMEAEVQRAENNRRLREMRIQADIAVEQQRDELIEQRAQNERKEAETKGYVLETTLKPFKGVDWKTLTALNNNADPRFNIALAFRELAENAGKIGNLTISPDLLEALLERTDPEGR
ncbi:MAG TPA: membrane protease subunit, stomatin/prohibitin [Blastocatellia bacterium]|nr:membrane protease subunit, stomatin/prohibitin [Blastocatellia bacterium]